MRCQACDCNLCSELWNALANDFEELCWECLKPTRMIRIWYGDKKDEVISTEEGIEDEFVVEIVEFEERAS